MQPEKVYVINLEVRTDRRKAFKEQEVLWQETFGCQPSRWIAVHGIALSGYGKGPWFRTRITERRKRSWAGKAGCILSHRAVIQDARRAGAETALIVEDDALLTREAAQLWKKTISGWIGQLPEDWAAVYLSSCTPQQPVQVAARTDEIRLLEVAGASNTVAYLLNGRVFAALLAELPEQQSIWPWVARHKAIDRWYSRNLNRFGRVYICSPSIVLQEQTSPSDITLTTDSVELLDYGHQGVRLVEGKASFKLRYGLFQLKNRVGRWCSLMRLIVKRARGL
jgi:GR25 family glycosyltransferase involved in LPS biosynthesis